MFPVTLGLVPSDFDLVLTLVLLTFFDCSLWISCWRSLSSCASSFEASTFVDIYASLENLNLYLVVGIFLSLLLPLDFHSKLLSSSGSESLSESLHVLSRRVLIWNSDRSSHSNWPTHCWDQFSSLTMLLGGLVANCHCHHRLITSFALAFRIWRWLIIGVFFVLLTIFFTRFLIVAAIINYRILRQVKINSVVSVFYFQILLHAFMLGHVIEFLDAPFIDWK